GEAAFELLLVVRAMKWQGSTIAYPARNHSPLRNKFASNQNNPAVCQQPQPRGGFAVSAQE
ncbi:hypothetical protein, partial [Dickeya dadantii]|uniref:hypothetical protein n=1 Tax=Dickeya dadantii TaxID=204038 RepID=UPI001C12FD37